MKKRRRKKSRQGKRYSQMNFVSTLQLNFVLLVAKKLNFIKTLAVITNLEEKRFFIFVLSCIFAIFGLHASRSVCAVFLSGNQVCNFVLAWSNRQTFYVNYHNKHSLSCNIVCLAGSRLLRLHWLSMIENLFGKNYKMV